MNPPLNVNQKTKNTQEKTFDHAQEIRIKQWKVRFVHKNGLPQGTHERLGEALA